MTVVNDSVKCVYPIINTVTQCQCTVIRLISLNESNKQSTHTVFLFPRGSVSRRPVGFCLLFNIWWQISDNFCSCYCCLLSLMKVIQTFCHANSSATKMQMLEKSKRQEMKWNEKSSAYWTSLVICVLNRNVQVLITSKNNVLFVIRAL